MCIYFSEFFLMLFAEDETFVKFKFSVWSTVEYPFNVQERFGYFPFFEEYDKNKQYSREEFEQDYGYGKHKYNFGLYTITICKDGQKHDQKKYVVAREILSKEDQELLKQYCECSYCQSPFYYFWKYFQCPHCLGCLHCTTHSQYMITKARQKFMDKTSK